MTNGIEVNQVVRVKSSGQLGRVVAVDDHHDRFPADLQLETVDGLMKVRVDEVQTFEQFIRGTEPLWSSPVVPTYNLYRIVADAIRMGAIEDRWDVIWKHIEPTFKKLEEMAFDQLKYKLPESMIIKKS